jgi:hypothetical protein
MPPASVTGPAAASMSIEPVAPVTSSMKNSTWCRPSRSA